MKKYSLPENLPPSELVTLDELRPYLAAAGSDPFEVHLHRFNQIVWFRAGTGHYYLTVANFMGQRRFGRKNIAGVLSGRDPAVLPACP